MEESNENDPFEDIEAAANRATLDLLPRKSRVQYDIAYSFRNGVKRKAFLENILKMYFWPILRRKQRYGRHHLCGQIIR